MNKKVVITGGSGFIGNQLTKILLDSGHSVVHADITPSKIYPELHQQCDICNEHDVRRVLAGADKVFHLAAEHRDDVRPVKRYYDVNVQGSANIAAACTELGIQHIVFTSSVAVYGLNCFACNESTSPEPFNHYGKSKLEAEKVLKKWQQENTENILTIVRPTAIFGKDNRGNIYNLLRQIINGPFLFIGNGKNKKSIAYVENIAAFLEFVAQKKSNTIFNYVDKPDFDMNNLVKTAKKVAHIKKRTKKIPYFIGITAGYCFDLLAKITRKKLPISSIRVKKFCANSIFDASKAHNSGFKAPCSLQQGLETTIKVEFLSK